MKKIEWILAGIATTGIILRICSIDGSATLVTIPVCLLSMLYMFFGFALFNNIRFRNIFYLKSYAGISWKQVVFSVYSGILFAYTVLAILFGVNQWPDAILLLSITISFILPTFITSRVLANRKPAPSGRGILVRSSIFMVAEALLLLFKWIGIW